MQSDHYAKNLFEKMHQPEPSLCMWCHVLVLVNNKWLPISASGNTDGLQQTSHKQTRLWFVLYLLKGTASIVLCGGELHQLGSKLALFRKFNDDNAI